MRAIAVRAHGMWLTLYEQSESLEASILASWSALLLSHRTSIRPSRSNRPSVSCVSLLYVCPRGRGGLPGWRALTKEHYSYCFAGVEGRSRMPIYEHYLACTQVQAHQAPVGYHGWYQRCCCHHLPRHRLRVQRPQYLRLCDLVCRLHCGDIGYRRPVAPMEGLKLQWDALDQSHGDAHVYHDRRGCHCRRYGCRQDSRQPRRME